MARKPIEWHVIESYEADDSALHQYVITLCGDRRKDDRRRKTKPGDTACLACQDKLLEIVNEQVVKFNLMAERLRAISDLSTPPEGWSD